MLLLSSVDSGWAAAELLDVKVAVAESEGGSEGAPCCLSSAVFAEIINSHQFHALFYTVVFEKF